MSETPAGVRGAEPTRISLLCQERIWRAMPGSCFGTIPESKPRTGPFDDPALEQTLS